MSIAAEHFRTLHSGAAAPLLLPNAWDAASAALLQDAGAAAVATSSAAVAWSLGYADGGALPQTELLAAVRRIMRVMKVPLTVDIENGYSDDPDVVAELVAALVGHGVAGINLEDGADSPTLLADKIVAIRKQVAAKQLFINARTDVYLKSLAPPGFDVVMTLRRATTYAAAGADGLFVPGLSACAAVTEISQGTELCLNLMAIPTLPTTAELFAAGMKRLSLGVAPFAVSYCVARDLVRPFLATGALEGMLSARRLDYGEMNAMFSSPTHG